MPAYGAVPLYMWMWVSTMPVAEDDFAYVTLAISKNGVLEQLKQREEGTELQAEWRFR